MGAFLLVQVVGMGLLACPLDWVVGVGMLALVFHGCTGTSSYLAQPPQSTLGHPGQQLGDTLCHQSTSGICRDVLLNVKQQQTPSWKGKILGHLGVKGEIVCFVSLYTAGLMKASVLKTE